MHLAPGLFILWLSYRKFERGGTTLMFEEKRLMLSDRRTGSGFPLPTLSRLKF